jgi:nucleotide-binding universal stress UspA family protein
MMNNTDYRYNKKILLAVDTSENSRRAVSYVSQMIGGLEGFNVIFLHVINPPEEDYFSSPSEHDKWLHQYRLKIEALLEKYRQILIQDGFDPKALSLRIVLRYRPSIAECIIEEQNRLGCSTIVVGRQGLSRSEEILFGSVSSKLVGHAKSCTVWIVE